MIRTNNDFIDILENISENRGLFLYDTYLRNTPKSTRAYTLYFG